MDIIISGNNKIIKIIKEISLDSNGNINEKEFLSKIKEIIEGNEKNEI
jgi:Ca2+-binding EF-hand superfamily protein